MSGYGAAAMWYQVYKREREKERENDRASRHHQRPPASLSHHAVEGDAIKAHLLPQELPVDAERVPGEGAAPQRQSVHARDHVLQALSHTRKKK